MEMEGVIKEARDRAIVMSTQKNTFEARLERILAQVDAASHRGEWHIVLSHLDRDCEIVLLPFFRIAKIHHYADGPASKYTDAYNVLRATGHVSIEISWKQ